LFKSMKLVNLTHITIGSSICGVNP